MRHGMSGGCLGTWLGGFVGATVGAGIFYSATGPTPHTPGLFGLILHLALAYYAAIGGLVGAVLGAMAGLLLGAFASANAEPTAASDPSAPAESTAAELARLKARVAELEAIRQEENEARTVVEPVAPPERPLLTRWHVVGPDQVDAPTPPADGFDTQAEADAEARRRVAAEPRSQIFVIGPKERRYRVLP